MILDKIIVSKIAPANTGVVWIKPVDDGYEQYIHLNGKWVKVDSSNKEDTHQPFRGWFASPSALSATYHTPKVGDYAYVKGATESADVYECNVAGTWNYSDRTFNPANNQEFASGEALNTVHIVDGLDGLSATDVLSAKQGKVLDQKVAALGHKIDDVALVHSETNDEGFHITDQQLNDVMRYTQAGFDVAKLSSHFISLLNIPICETEESVFAIVDEQLNIGLLIDKNGVFAKNVFNFNIINN